MEKLVGIRREDKNIWERRVPITPESAKLLTEKEGIKFIVQDFPERIYKNEEYLKAGIQIREDIGGCPFVFAVKEIPVHLIGKNKVYMFFSHTIKGQDYNMPLLRRIMDSKSSLIDYEPITDDKGRRLVFFGKFAGIAGMIETFNVLGSRLKRKGFETDLLEIMQAYKYADAKDAKDKIKNVGDRIAAEGLPESISPIVIGFAGYGNVSLGAQEIFDLLPHDEITPEQLRAGIKTDKPFVKVVFKEEDIVEPKKSGEKFVLQDYYDNPNNYKSKFQRYLEHIDVLINAIYWTEDYPRLITKEYLRNNYSKIKMDIVCDISCDIGGSIEITYKATEPDAPAYVFNPISGKFTDGYDADGIVDLAVDNLPTELPKDASDFFSAALTPFIPGIVNADYNLPFEEVNLPPEIKRAVIVYKGELTPNFEYLKEFLK